ncbi:MAG: ATP-binding protein [Luteolibacter sp.]
MNGPWVIASEPGTMGVNWITVIWPMMTAVSVTLALINLRMAFGDGRRAPHLLFSCAALGIAMISVLELMLMLTDDLARYNAILRLSGIPIALALASLVGFVRTFLGPGPMWLGVSGVLLNAAAHVVSLASHTPVIRYAVDLRRKESFGCVEWTIPTIVNGAWDGVAILGLLLVILFILDTSRRLWKRGGKRRALIVGGSMVAFLFLNRTLAILVDKGFVEMPYMVTFPFICVICAMGLELADDVLRASDLARELQESQRRMDLAGRAASLGFWELDIPGGKIWASETSRELFGVGVSEEIDLNTFFATLHPDDREGVAEALRVAIEGGSDYEREYRVMLGDGGMRWISARGRGVIGCDGKMTKMRGVLLDETERRRSETELAQIRGQLAHAGRISMMGQLAAALAHELNQPLGAILRNAEAAALFLKTPEPDLEELRAILHDIEKDDKRAGGVIERLRALLKRKDIEIRPVALKELLDEVGVLIRAEASVRGVRVMVVAPEDLPPVRGDRVHLQQVLINLVINGMDALAGMGREERRVTISARHGEPGLVEVRVEDTGPGIEEKVLPQVFDPFFTTKPNGMGMGLPICRTIVEAHDGVITAESGPGGASVRFTLPV